MVLTIMIGVQGKKLDEVSYHSSLVRLRYRLYSIAGTGTTITPYMYGEGGWNSKQCKGG
jgi:hypothetical protein